MPRAKANGRNLLMFGLRVDDDRSFVDDDAAAAQHRGGVTVLRCTSLLVVDHGIRGAQRRRQPAQGEGREEQTGSRAPRRAAAAAGRSRPATGGSTAPRRGSRVNVY